MRVPSGPKSVDAWAFIENVLYCQRVRLMAIAVRKHPSAVKCGGIGARVSKLYVSPSSATGGTQRLRPIESIRETGLFLY